MSLRGPVEVAISCVIPACLNTNIQTAQLQHKPGKHGAEEALHCVPRRCRADGKRLGPCAPGAQRGPAGSRCPPDELLCILLPGFLSPGPREAGLKVAPWRGAKKGLAVGALLKRPSPSLVWARSQSFCIRDFPHSALHVVPLASQASINPFLSQEPAFRAGGMLFSPGDVQPPPSQPLLCHSPFLHRDFWLLLW